MGGTPTSAATAVPSARLLPAGGGSSGSAGGVKVNPAPAAAGGSCAAAGAAGAASRAGPVAAIAAGCRAALLLTAPARATADHHSLGAADILHRLCDSVWLLNVWEVET